MNKPKRNGDVVVNIVATSVAKTLLHTSGSIKVAEFAKRALGLSTPDPAASLNYESRDERLSGLPDQPDAFQPKEAAGEPVHSDPRLLCFQLLTEDIRAA